MSLAAASRNGGGHSASAGSGQREAQTTARHAASGRRAHQMCSVEMCPCRIDFSRRAWAEMRAIGRSTSMRRFGYIMTPSHPLQLLDQQNPPTERQALGVYSCQVALQVVPAHGQVITDGREVSLVVNPFDQAAYLGLGNTVRLTQVFIHGGAVQDLFFRSLRSRQGESRMILVGLLVAVQDRRQGDFR